MSCLGALGDGAWHRGQWAWANGSDCGFHLHARREAQRLFAGKQFLFLGNSVVRHMMYAALNLLVGATSNKSTCAVCGKDAEDPARAVYDQVSKEAAVAIADLTAGTFQVLGPGGLCRMSTCRTYVILPPSERGQSSGLERVERVTVQVDWIVGWGARHGEGARGEGARGRGDGQLLSGLMGGHERRLRASLTSLFDAGGWCAPPTSRRNPGSGLNCTREAGSSLADELLLRVRPSDVHPGCSQVTAWLFARHVTGQVSVQWASRLALRSLAPRLTAWARAPCEGAVQREGAAGHRLPCTLVTNVTVGITGGSGYHNCSLKCPRTSYEEAVSRAVAQFVPAGHEWTVLSHVFSWTGVEDGQILHLCSNWDAYTWGYGTDVVVAAPSAIDDSASALLARRGAADDCFNSRNKSAPLLLREPHRRQPAQMEAARALLASDAAAGKATHVWSYSAALEAAAAKPSSGVRQVEHTLRSTPCLPHRPFAPRCAHPAAPIPPGRPYPLQRRGQAVHGADAHERAGRAGAPRGRLGLQRRRRQRAWPRRAGRFCLRLRLRLRLGRAHLGKPAGRPSRRAVRTADGAEGGHARPGGGGEQSGAGRPEQGELRCRARGGEGAGRGGGRARRAAGARGRRSASRSGPAENEVRPLLKSDAAESVNLGWGE